MAKQSRRKRLSDPRFVFSVSMAMVFIVIFVVGLIATPGSGDTNIIQDTEFSTLVPTVLAPPPPDSEITLGKPQIQRNGLFQFTPPDGWVVRENIFDNNLPEASMFFENSTRFSSVHILLQLGVNYASLQELADDLFTDTYFITVWSNYEGFTETARTINDDLIQIDFLLTANNIDYLGRQITWLEEDWMHSMRLIVPDNNPELMETLQNETASTFIAYEDQRETQPNFTGYADQESGFLIRYLGLQAVVNTPGSPAIFATPDENVRLLVRQLPETPIQDLTGAEDYLRQTLHPSASVTASQITTRQYGEGFLVSYSDRDNDGNPLSGVVALLNDVDQNLYLADLQIFEPEIDLLASEGFAEYSIYRGTIDTFMILPPAR